MSESPVYVVWRTLVLRWNMSAWFQKWQALLEGCPNCLGKRPIWCENIGITKRYWGPSEGNIMEFQLRGKSEIEDETPIVKKTSKQWMVRLSKRRNPKRCPTCPFWEELHPRISFIALQEPKRKLCGVWSKRRYKCALRRLRAAYRDCASRHTWVTLSMRYTSREPIWRH